MVIEMFLALPLFTKNEQPLFKDICMEFIPHAPGLCTDEGNNPVYLINKIPAMLRVNTASGRYEQHTFCSEAGRKKVSGFSSGVKNIRQEICPANPFRHRPHRSFPSRTSRVNKGDPGSVREPGS